MPPQTVVTGTQIPLDQAQIDYWLGQLQNTQRGQNFGFGGQLLDFMNNRDRNRASANTDYGNLGLGIAGLNAAQRGQLASAQQAAIQMLADRSGPQNAVAYQRALAGLSGPGPNQGQTTIDLFALLKDFYQPASIEDIYPGGPPQTSSLDVESVIKEIFDQGKVAPPEPPAPGGGGEGAAGVTKEQVEAAIAAWNAMPEGPEKEAARGPLAELTNRYLFGDDDWRGQPRPADPGANGDTSLLPPTDTGALPDDASGVKQLPPVAPYTPPLPTPTPTPTPELPSWIGDNPPPMPNRPMPTDESGVMQVLSAALGGGQPTRPQAEAAAQTGDIDTLNAWLFGSQQQQQPPNPAAGASGILDPIDPAIMPPGPVPPQPGAGDQLLPPSFPQIPWPGGGIPQPPPDAPAPAARPSAAPRPVPALRSVRVRGSAHALPPSSGRTAVAA